MKPSESPLLRNLCLKWLSNTSDSYKILNSEEPKAIVIPTLLKHELFDATFLNVKKWDDFSPYAGKIILYQTTNTHLSNNDVFKLYSNYSKILVGLISCIHMPFDGERGFGIDILGTPNCYSMNTLLTTSQVKSYNFKLRLPTITELNIIKEAVLSNAAKFSSLYARESIEQQIDNGYITSIEDHSESTSMSPVTHCPTM